MFQMMVMNGGLEEHPKEERNSAFRLRFGRDPGAVRHVL
jgi:hypothetical protein